MSNAEKLLSFLEEKANGEYIRANDFLKSLYPVPKANEIPKWQNQQEMKQLKLMLTELSKNEKITCNANGHLQLGRPFYEGQNQVQRFYHLGNLSLNVRLGVDESGK